MEAGTDPGRGGTIVVPVDLRDLAPPTQGKELNLGRARKNFTWFVLIGFGLTILATLVSVFTGDSTEMLAVLERLLPAQSAVVASTLGFYFISRPAGL